MKRWSLATASMPDPEPVSGTVNVEADRGEAVQSSFDGVVLKRAIRHYVPASIVPPALAVAAAAVFTRVFLPDEYGYYSIAMSTALLITALGAEWLKQGINRFLPGEQRAHRVKRLKAAASLATSGLVVALLLVAVPVVALVNVLAGSIWLAYAVPAALMVVTGVVFGVAGVVLQAEMRAARFTWIRVSESLARFGLAVAIVFTVYRNAGGLIWAAAASLGLAGLIAWRAAGLSSPVLALAMRRSGRRALRLLARYGVPMIGWWFASRLLHMSDRYVILAFRGSSEVGIYSVAYDLVFGGGSIVAAPALMAAHPFLMSAWSRGDRRQAAQWLATTTEWVLVAGLWVTAVLFVFSEDVAALLLGVEYRAGHVVMPVVFAGVVAWQVGLYTHKPLEFSKRTMLMFAVVAAVALVNLVANVLIVPRYGYVGAAYTTLASYGLYAIVTAGIGQRVVRWGLPRARLFRWLAIVLAGTAGLFAVRSLVHPSLGYLGSLGVATILGGAGFVLLVRGMVADARSHRPGAAA